MFPRRPHPWLVVLTLLAAAVIVTRATRQSITIDEADSYLIWATSPEPWHWEGNSNNHILNSSLMRLSTMLFGTSPLTTRLPALLGSMIYLLAVLRILALMAPPLRVQIPVFLCLVFNPFVLDYLVAARGYGLALGFFVAALGLLTEELLLGGSSRLAAIGTCLALAVASNFSFTLVCAATFTVAASRRPWREVVWSALPGAAITLMLCSYGLLRFHRADLTYGAKSVAQFAGSMITPSFHEPSRFLVNPLLYPLFTHARTFLIVALVIALAALALAALRRDRTLLALSAVFCLLGSASFVAHYSMFRMFRVPLPEGRTGLYFVPLVLLGVAAALRPSAQASVRRAQLAVTVALVLLAAHHLGCLRIGYFYEWQYDAGVDKAWRVASRYAHEHNLRTVGTRWMYYSSLRYYHTAENETRFEVVEPEKAQAPYVFAVHYLFEQDLVEKYGLRVVFRDELSDVAIAVSPELTKEHTPLTSLPAPKQQRHNGGKRTVETLLSSSTL